MSRWLLLLKSVDFRHWIVSPRGNWAGLGISRLWAHEKYRKGRASSHFGLSEYWRLPFIGSHFGLVLYLIPGGFLVSSRCDTSTDISWSWLQRAVSVTSLSHSLVFPRMMLFNTFVTGSETEWDKTAWGLLFDAVAAEITASLSLVNWSSSSVPFSFVAISDATALLTCLLNVFSFNSGFFGFFPFSAFDLETEACPAVVSLQVFNSVSWSFVSFLYSGVRQKQN